MKKLKFCQRHAISIWFFFIGILVGLALAICISMVFDAIAHRIIVYLDKQEQQDLKAWMQYRQGAPFDSLDPATQARLLTMKPVGFDMVGAGE